MYLKQLFPQMNLADNGLRVGGAFVANGVATAPAGSVPLLELDPNQTLVFFLTGGPPTSFQGFSNNRALPFTPAASGNENRLGPFLDFPSTRYASGTDAVALLHASDRADTTVLGAASLMDPWGSPYAYFAFSPGANGYMGTPFVFRGTTVSYYRDASGKAMNQKGFQLISAGENGPDDAPPYGFGSGGSWVSGTGEYADSGAGFDDVSNFHEGQLGVK